MKNALVNGLIGGVVSIILFLILNAINPAYNFNMWGYILVTLISIIFPIRAGLQERKEKGGHIGFGEVFLISFVVMGISTLMGMIITYFIIDNNPELQALIQNQSIEINSSMMSAMGLSEAEIALNMEEMENINLSSFKVMIMGWFSSLIYSLPVAAIISFFIKKEEKG